jgi:hypothetical protein
MTIRTIRPEWTLVVEKMILVSLHVGRWRAATRTEFREFGLDADAFRAYTTGTRRLLPQRLHQELQTLERMARDLQARFSYQTLFGYLMPKEAYDEFKAWIDRKPAAGLRDFLHHKQDAPDAWKTASLRERWFALGEQIAAQRDAIVDEMVESYRPSAIVRWRVQNGLPKDGDAQPPDTWLDDILTQMVRRIPSAAEIRGSFALDIAPAFVEAPDEAVKATKLEAIARQEAEVKRRLSELDTIHLQAKRERTRLALQAEREKLERERRITQEVIAHEKKLKQERIEQTLDAVAGQLHTLVYTAVCDGLEMVKSKGKLHPRWVGRVKQLVDQVRVLDFTDDAELARVCRELEQLTEDNAASPASASRMREALVDLGISLKADLVRKARRQARETDLFARPGESPAPIERQARVLEAAPAVA